MTRDILDVRTKHIQRNGLRMDMLSVECSMCGAPPHIKCVTLGGNETSAHSARHKKVMLGSRKEG